MPLTTLAELRRLAILRDQKNVPVFIEALDHSDSTMRAFACDALGWIRARRHTVLLTRMLNDTSEEVRYAATANIALCGAPPNIQSLVDRLVEAPSHRVRARAARVIGFLRLSAAATLHDQLLTESTPDVLTQIVYALGQLEYGPALKDIVALSDVANTALRIECIRTITRLRPTQALPSNDLTHADPHIRVAAIRSLVVTDAQTFCDRAADLFEDENPGVRCAVIVGLRAVGTPDSSEILKGLPRDAHPEVCRHLDGPV